jgi:hypothetical protein
VQSELVPQPSLIRHHEHDVLQDLLVAAALLEEGKRGGDDGLPGQAGAPLRQQALQVIIMRSIT